MNFTKFFPEPAKAKRIRRDDEESLMSWLHSRVLSNIISICMLLSTNSCANQPEQSVLMEIEDTRAANVESIAESDMTSPTVMMSTATETIFVPPTQTLNPTQTPTITPTATPTLVPTPTEDPVKREFDEFVAKMMNGNPDEIVGVFVEDVLKLRVVQQPGNNAAFVSSFDGEATQFLLAFTVAGNIGLLAHNYLAGRYFFDLVPGDIVQLIYGDGSYIEFEITDIQEYQALSPNSPTSDFIDLRTGTRLSATNLFYQVYGGDYHLTFQTCIARDNSSEWGRLFPIALPYE